MAGNYDLSGGAAGMAGGFMAGVMSGIEKYNTYSIKNYQMELLKDRMDQQEKLTTARVENMQVMQAIGQQKTELQAIVTGLKGTLNEAQIEHLKTQTDVLNEKLKDATNPSFDEQLKKDGKMATFLRLPVQLQDTIKQHYAQTGEKLDFNSIGVGKNYIFSMTTPSGDTIGGTNLVNYEKAKPGEWFYSRTAKTYLNVVNDKEFVDIYGKKYEKYKQGKLDAFRQVGAAQKVQPDQNALKVMGKDPKNINNVILSDSSSVPWQQAVNYKKGY